MEFCLKITGSKSSKIINFDSEAGSKGVGLILEGCHSINVDSLYFENYVDGNPINIKGYGDLSSLNNFSTDITISNARFYNCSTRPVYLYRGVRNLKIENCFNEFNYDTEKPITNNSNDFISLQGSLDREFCKYYSSISVLDNTFLDESQINRVFQDGYAPCFIHNGNVYLGGNNLKYYSPTYERGTTLIHAYANPVTRQFVKNSGSYGTLSGITGSTTNGSNIVNVNDTLNIIPGTYLNIGSLERVKVLSKTNNRIVISKTSNITQSNVSITYSEPVLVDMQ